MASFDTAVSLLNDTVYIHDTTYIDHYVHDTFFVNHYIHDTVYRYINHYVHDTTIFDHYIHDTIRVTEYVYDTTYVDCTDILYIHDTVYLHDTLYIDPNGIDDIQLLNAKIYQRVGQIVVEGAAGNTVNLYDTVGRLLATKQDENAPLYFNAPAAGTYLIRIGTFPARRIVVIR